MSDLNELQLGVPSEEEHPDRYLAGLRLFLAVFGLGLSVFLPSLEVSVVSTSLVTISNDLNEYDRSSWIITAYLITYSGFLIIWSKLSDHVGIKPVLFISMIIFMVFSGCCGAARTINQLYDRLSPQLHHVWHTEIAN